MNGKFIPSVQAGNLTVSLKNLDGSDPSVSNPVVVRINGADVQISSPLSVTRNAGTNWCDAANPMTADRKLDFFVYVGYSPIDGPWLGFSRLLHSQATDYFKPYGPDTGPLTNPTSTFYCAMSTDANEANGDSCIQIGRFCAILSSGYQWVLPSFPGIYIVQGQILESRWMYFTPSLVSQTGAIGSYSISVGQCRYKLFGKSMYVQTYALINSKGSAGGYAYFSIPHTTTIATHGVGFDQGNYSNGGLVTSTNGDFLKVHLANGGSPFADGAGLSTFTNCILETEEA